MRSTVGCLEHTNHLQSKGTIRFRDLVDFQTGGVLIVYEAKNSERRFTNGNKKNKMKLITTRSSNSSAFLLVGWLNGMTWRMTLYTVK